MSITRSHLSWIPVIILWIVFIIAVYALSLHSASGLKAFQVYYESAKSLVQDNEQIYQGTNGWIYLYPPLLSQLLMPIAASMDYQTASNLWLSINIALLITTLAILNRYTPPKWSKWMWSLPILFIPVWQAMYIGQITIVMLALLTYVWVAIREGRPRLAGGLLALAAWIKVFPAILVIYFLWKRNWQVIRGVIIAGLALVLLQVAISGPDLVVAFFDVLYQLTSNGQPSATFENMSIFGFASRLFQPNIHVEALLVDSDLFALNRWTITLFILITTAFAVSRSHIRSRHHQLSWRFDVEYGLVILTMLMLGSTLWVSGLPPMILIGLLIIRHRRHRQMRRVRALWFISFALIVIYQPLIVIATLFNATLNALTLSIGFFGLIIAWGTMVWLLLVEPESESTITDFKQIDIIAGSGES